MRLTEDTAGSGSLNLLVFSAFLPDFTLFSPLLAAFAASDSVLSEAYIPVIKSVTPLAGLMTGAFMFPDAGPGSLDIELW